MLWILFLQNWPDTGSDLSAVLIAQVENWYRHAENETWLLSHLQEKVFSSLSQEETGSLNNYASEKEENK